MEDWVERSLDIGVSSRQVGMWVGKGWEKEETKVCRKLA